MSFCYFLFQMHDNMFYALFYVILINDNSITRNYYKTRNGIKQFIKIF